MSTTVLEGPVPGPSTSNRRRRTSPEVIDVDEFDGDDVQIVGNSRPAQRRRLDYAEWVADNDDAQATAARVRRLSPRRIARQRSRVFSPAPRPVDRSVPPVPPLPPYLAREHMPPMRMRPPPFPGEPGPSPPPAAAPPSHHHPVMGFGGALLALNRQNAVAENIAAQRQQDTLRRRQQAMEARSNNYRMSWNLPSLAQATGFFADMFRGFAPHPQRHQDGPLMEEDRFHDWMDFMGGLGYDEDQEAFDFPWGRGHGPFPHPYRRERRAEIDYKPEYTHPGKPEPGFSFDFNPPAPPSKSVIVIDDSPGPSTSGSLSAEETSSVLVCARCLDPLIMGSGSETSEEAQRKRRIWALRCGHMLDGKCIEVLMKPGPERLQDEAERTAEKDKGKAPASAPSEASPPTKYTGKGKAKATPVPDSSSAIQEDAAYNTASFVPVGDSARPEAGAGSTSIRSRLRSHNALAPGPEAPVPTNTAPRRAHAAPARPMRRLPRRSRAVGTESTGNPPAPAPARGRGKGKAKARQPVVERLYEWTCPVAGCGKVHATLLIDGKWTADPERGVIALYV